MGWFCRKIKISVFGGENAVKPGDSGYKPGYSGFWKTLGETPGISSDTPGLGHSGGWDTPGETPGIGPETPDLGVRILRVFVRILRIFGDCYGPGSANFV